MLAVSNVYEMIAGTDSLHIPYSQFTETLPLFVTTP